MIRTAEYCRIGHVDRVCNIIADGILDECLKQDPNTRSAIEVFGCHGVINVGGELTTKAIISVSTIVKNIYKEIGYRDEMKVIVNIAHQSPEICVLANEGAGDSGVVTGYATNETPDFLPLEVYLAKRVADALDDTNVKWLLPDGKVQITLSTETKKVTNVVISYQCNEEKDAFVRELAGIILGEYIDDSTKWILVPFEKGGFDADTGLTGRKNVLWYGPRVPVGGGSFAGKDATKVDRSGAYLARSIAVTEIRQGHKEVFVEIAYAIGEKDALYVKVNGVIVNSQINNVEQAIKALNLKEPVFKEASIRGHFGYDSNWEK